MDPPHLLVFAAAYFAALVLPGPGVTALVARVLARGTNGAPAFIAGFVVGSLIWFAIAATGLAVLAAGFVGPLGDVEAAQLLIVGGVELESELPVTG